MFSFDLLFEAVLFGLLLGCFYAAVSLGLSVAFGLLDVPYVAHPALLVTGSYFTYVLHSTLGLDPLISGVLAMPGTCRDCWGGCGRASWRGARP